MDKFKQLSKNESYMQSSMGIFMFFCAWGIWWSFFQRWLVADIHLTNTEVGQIYSINSFASLIIMFIYGIAQDELGIKRHLAIFVSAVAALVGPFVQFVYAPMISGPHRWAGIVIGSIVLSAGFMSASSLIEAITERYSRKFNFEYGQSRAWGSFGYAIVALVAGFLFNVNPLYNFWLGSVFGCGMLAVYIFWRPQEQKEVLRQEADPNAPRSTPTLKEITGVLRMPSLWLMVVLIMFTYTFYTVFDQQMFPTYYTSLFASQATGNSTYGILNSIQVFCESAMMGLVPILMRKIGVRNSLLLGATVMFVRIGLCGVFHDPYTVSCVKMLHAIEVPLFSLPTFRYFTLHFDTKLSATLYLVGFHVASKIGESILSTPLGMLHDAAGDRVTFLIIAAIVLVALVYGYFILKKDDVDVNGDPFIRDSKNVKGIDA